MKKMAIFILSVLLCCIFAGCSAGSATNNGQDSNESDSTKITSVSVQSMPDRTAYTIGETFSPDGGVLRIERANGDTEDISFSDENIVLTYPSTLDYWTDNQRIGVCYNDPLNNNEQSETVYFGVQVGLDIDYKMTGYSGWSKYDLFICYPSDYSVSENEGDTGIGGATYIDLTEKIVSFSSSDFGINTGKGKSIFIKSGSVNGLRDMLDKATTYLDTYYTERYQEAYRESYDDDSLEVTVRHQYLTTAEYDALKHFQWKDAIHQIITIKKDGTFLGLGDWEKRIDQYILQGDGNTVDISFWANNSIYEDEEIQEVLSSLMVKYSAVYTDAA